MKILTLLFAVITFSLSAQHDRVPPEWNVFVDTLPPTNNPDSNDIFFGASAMDFPLNVSQTFFDNIEWDKKRELTWRQPGLTVHIPSGYVHVWEGDSTVWMPIGDVRGIKPPPSLYELSRITKTEPVKKYLFVFKKQKTAQVVSEIAGYGFIALGAYLSGKAEYYSRYHGTTSDFDTYHVTRDAGLVSTGLGCILVGSSFALDDKLELWEVGVKGFGMLLGFRSIAETTYNAMKDK